MANRRGLGASKKYANGSIHENGSGKFMIKDRFTDDNDVVMLEIEWLSGEKEGRIETNKEVNISASIHKFQVNRAAASVITSIKREEVSIPVVITIEQIHAVILENQEYVKGLDKRLDSLQEITSRYGRVIETLTEQLQRLSDHNTLLIKQQEALNKLIEKI